MTRDGWMTVTEAAVKMRLTEHEVRALAVAGELEHRVDLDHQMVSLRSVDAYLVARELLPDIRGGEPLTPGEEDEYRLSQRDDVNDRGDNEQ